MIPVHVWNIVDTQLFIKGRKEGRKGQTNRQKEREGKEGKEGKEEGRKAWQDYSFHCVPLGRYHC